MKRWLASGPVLACVVVAGALVGCGSSSGGAVDALGRDAASGSDGAEAADATAVMTGDGAAPQDAAANHTPDGGDAGPMPSDAGPADLGGDATASADGCVACDAGFDGEVGADAHAADAEAGGGVHPVQIAVGLQHACTVMNDGSVRCWGDNTWGQLGDGTRQASRTAVVASLLGGARAVSVAPAREGTCALLDSGRVRCWGAVSGLLEGGSDPLVKDAGVQGVKVLVGARLRWCVLPGDGHARCWGKTADDQLGAPASQGQPSVVIGLEGALALAPGFHHTCAIRAGGLVSCWGGGTHTAGAMDVPGLTNSVMVSAAMSTSCAGAADGTVRCWQDNLHAESPPGWVPVPVEGLRGASALAGSCGLFADGAVACRSSSTGVVAKAPLSQPAVALAADGESGRMCAITSDKAVWCWQPSSAAAPERFPF